MGLGGGEGLGDGGDGEVVAAMTRLGGGGLATLAATVGGVACFSVMVAGGGRRGIGGGGTLGAGGLGLGGTLSFALPDSPEQCHACALLRRHLRLPTQQVPGHAMSKHHLPHPPPLPPHCCDACIVCVQAAQQDDRGGVGCCPASAAYASPALAWHCRMRSAPCM